MPDHDVACDWAIPMLYSVRGDQGKLLHLSIFGAHGAGKKTLVHQLLSENRVAPCAERISNVVSAMANSDLAVIVVDAVKGVDQQTHRQSDIAAMMGIRHVVVAVNKMDLVGFDEKRYQKVVKDCRELAAASSFVTMQCIPVDALSGKNILEPSVDMPWSTGLSLLPYLCGVEVVDDVRAADNSPPEVADQFEARLLWLSDHVMTPGRQYAMTLMNREVAATVTEIKYRDAVDTGAHLAAKTLELGEVGTINLSTNSPIVFESFQTNRALGAFMLSDRLSGEMVGIGHIAFALRRANNIHWQALEINRESRSAQKNQEAKCIWFTGLSGSGKSTIANLLEKRLHGDGKHTYLLDGDNVRHGLNRDLGFTEADRVENIRRVAEVAKLMVDAGLIVLVSFISPFRTERRMARDLFVEGEFIEVFVDTPIDECEKRDVKGLYAKARRGDLKNFTGIDSPYEAPEAAEIHLQTIYKNPESCAEEVLSRLR